MAFNYTSSSHNFVPEYQQSGIPHLETKTLVVATFPQGTVSSQEEYLIDNISDFKFQFEYVTRWIIIHNHVDNNGVKKHIRVYFNETAAKKAYRDSSDDHYLLLDGETETHRLEIKCKEIWIVPDVSGTTPKVSIIAGLTSVPKNNFPDLTFAKGFTGTTNSDS